MDWNYIFDLQQILDYMEQHLREKIGVKEIAASVGYSPWYCNRLFKAYFGESLASYLRQLRMMAAKGDLRESGSIEGVARSLSFDSPDGFSRAFQAQFGITPSRYLQGGVLKEQYVKTYEYRYSDALWGRGDNPTPDGLWEFAYYDAQTGKYDRMEWNGSYFCAPFETASASDPYWYCRNRNDGYGMHPAKGVRAVRSFLCPHGGTVDVFFSVGRVSKVIYAQDNESAVQLHHNDTPLSPAEGPAVLDNPEAVFLTGTCTVRRGDRISLHLDSMGNSSRDGLFLYRQRIGYRRIDENE
ncbi:MAG: helix-turn-helix transcriptional regulator [Clostridia bacterium]|nr:helix-turn-helix transcriptional regulator [Clostridia bacterium]